MPETLLQTPLDHTHRALGAHMLDFAGWSMPLYFAGIRREHVHTRTVCSLFDVSHMGRIRLAGRDSSALVNRVCTRGLGAAEVGRSYYSHICRDDGGILDDVIVSRFEAHWLIVCNASNREKILTWLTDQRAGGNVEIDDQTLDTAMIALQGPRALTLAQEIVSTDLASIRPYRFRVFDVMGIPITLFRSGYTGEDGFEVILPRGLVSLLLPKVLGTASRPHPEIKPAGLGARDTLRMEAGMPLYGHELSEQVDPLTAGLAWCVDLDRGFIGAAALRKLQAEGLKRRLVGLELEGRRTPRQGYNVVAEGRPVGEITSGVLSPTLGKSLAMAYVDAALAAGQTSLEVDFGARRVAAVVVKLPFYKRAKSP